MRDDLLAPDYVNHTPSVGAPRRESNGLKPIVLAMRRAFSRPAMGEGFASSEFLVRLVFGWPGAIAAVMTSIVAVVSRRPRWFVVAAILLAPFSVWMSGYPLIPWSILLPGLPLLGVVSIRRGHVSIAWLATGVLIAILAWLRLRISG